MNDLEAAVIAAATEGGAPPMVFELRDSTAVEFPRGRVPFDGLVWTAWQ